MVKGKCLKSLPPVESHVRVTAHSQNRQSLMFVESHGRVDYPHETLFTLIR